MPKQTDRDQQLSNLGYCTVAKVLSPELLHALQKRFAAAKLKQTAPENFSESGAFVKLDYREPLVAQLLAWPKTLLTLKELGFAEPKLHSFYVSTKPPKAKELAWHSDLFYEYAQAAPAELFLIYYLQDTYPENGCLRVIPGSHINPNTKNKPVDVPVKAGDLFIGDRRILHATRANASGEWRTCLTIAYAPAFAQLPEAVQAMIVNNQCLPQKGWHGDDSFEVGDELRAVLPVYEG